MDMKLILNELMKSIPEDKRAELESAVVKITAACDGLDNDLRVAALQVASLRMHFVTEDAQPKNEEP